MKSPATFRRLIPHALSAILLLSSSPCHAQGSLTPPPGVPAATMKTLDQIESRTPVNATTCPGDAASLYKITQPGSYYLTGNITGVDPIKSGINITTANVTLDLNGFTLAAAAGATHGDGIQAYKENIVIANGTVSGWYRFGIEGYSNVGGRYTHLTLRGNGTLIPGSSYLGGGLSATSATVSHCSFLNNNASGLNTNGGVIVSHCSAFGNDSTGIDLNVGGTAIDCTARSNRTGISVGYGASATGCSASNNTSFGISSSGTLVNCSCSNNTGGGIKLNGDARASQCTATQNGSGSSGSGMVCSDRCALDHCTASYNKEHGIVCGIYALIESCTATHNSDDGIQVAGGSVVRNSTAMKNGTAGAAAGIRATGSGSVLENNIARDNTGTGILATAGDTIIRNSSGVNSVANYIPNSGANFAPIQTPASQTNPNANH